MRKIDATSEHGNESVIKLKFQLRTLDYSSSAAKQLQLLGWRCVWLAYDLAMPQNWLIHDVQQLYS